ncbi:MAG: nucleotidyl transferase AbiEii/AbiGii toxin family protein [Actinomycetota bacterium]
MITRAELMAIADEQRVEFKTVERDYVLTQILADLYPATGETGGLVFKGGTLLRACYFEDYRYSADLDFSLIEPGIADSASAHVTDRLPRCRDRVGFDVLEPVEVNRQPHVAYQLPDGKRRKIKLNISPDEVAHEPVEQTLIARYNDVPSGCQVMSFGLVEVLAEKFRCVMQRRQCRDLFDLHHLLEQGVDLEAAWWMFEEKAQEKQLDPGGFADAFNQRMPGYESDWEREMTGYLVVAPRFDLVERQARRRLRPYLR